MKVAKNILTLTGCALIIYFLIFAIWLTLAIGCLGREEISHTTICGEDKFTQIVRITHAPVISGMRYILKKISN